MPDYQWPDAAQRSMIGKRVTRVDSPLKVSGRAKYTYDYHGKDQLYGKVLRSPYARARIVSIDTSAAEKMPGVKAVEIIQKPGATVQWAGDEVVAVAAVDEATAEDAVRAIRVKFAPQEHNVSDAEPPAGAGDSAGPLSEDDIWDGLDQMTPEKLVEEIASLGVSYKVTPDGLADMNKDGVPTVVTDALAKAPYHEVKEGSGHSWYQKAAAVSLGDADKGFAE